MTDAITTGTPHSAAMYQLIYNSKKISKQEIAQQMQLSLPTVTQTLHQLLADELIVTDGKFSSQVGRRAVVYSPNRDRRFAIGLEIFSDHATLSLLNVMFENLGTARLTIDFTTDDTYFTKLAQWLHQFLLEQKIDQDKVIGVGIGIQGLISPDGKTVLYGKILDCTGLTSARFETAFGLPVTLYHDADCVAMAEQTLSKDHRDAVYLSIGEHLGTAIMIDDDIYTGQNGRSGTMEHITLNSQTGKQCYCGRKGCLETYSALSALLQPGEVIDQFMQQVAAGEPAASVRWQQYLDDLAEVINNLHMFVDNRIVLAGDLVQYLDDAVLTTVNQRIRQITAFPEDRDYVQLGTVRNRPVSTGAAIPLIKAALQTIQ
ncbi:ROK family transcriptional regulator [Furfurilactobacillus curtus]|uniref:NagC family transcriptional regulator n=1 Tax=Furfurilactobacillus curtus TaxID=1746200 RepID=A0ABQ5JRM3_9LACO